MDAGKLKEIEAQSNYPKGIAARIDSPDLKRLIEERRGLLFALATLCKAVAEDDVITEHGTPAGIRAARGLALDVITQVSL